MSISGRTTIKQGTLYLISNLIRQLVSFLMLPIYTRHLTPKDYGVVEMLVFSVSVLQIVMGLRMFSALIKFYHDAKNEHEQKELISSAFVTAVSACGLAALVLMLLSHPISNQLLGSYDYTYTVILFSLTLPAGAAEEFAIVYLRLRYKAGTVFAISMLKLVLQLGLNIYLVAYKEMHVMGAVWGSVISTGAMGMIGLYYVARHSGLQLSIPIAKKMIAFSIPLWVSQLGSFYITYGDRYFLKMFRSLDEVGIYSLAYRFGFLLMVVSYSPFSRVWEPQSYEIYRQPNRTSSFQRVFLYITIVMVLAGLGISVYVKDVIQQMASPSFWSAHAIVPVLMIAYLLQGLMYFCNFSLMVSESTRDVAIGSLITCIVITLCYILLIPPFGAMGAAVATAIAFACQLLWVKVRGDKFFEMKLPWLRASCVITAGIACYLLTLLIPESLWISLSLRTGIILLFIGIVLITPILPIEDRSALIAILKHPQKIASYFKPTELPKEQQK